MKPEHYQMLAEAKMTVEQIGVVMRIMAEAEDAMKAAEEARKSVARERVQRWREKQKDAVTLPKHSGNATVRLTRVEDSSSKKDISEKEESKNLSHEFETEFWPAYPRKVGKPAALKAYLAARKRSSFEAIMVGVRRYAQERAGEEAQFTKYPQGWLSGDHWNDEPTPRTAPRPHSTASPPETVGSLSRKQLFTPKAEIDVTDYSTGSVEASGPRRLSSGSGDARPFTVSGDILGRI
jgi:hypothetical protein